MVCQVTPRTAEVGVVHFFTAGVILQEAFKESYRFQLSVAMDTVGVDDLLLIAFEDILDSFPQRGSAVKGDDFYSTVFADIRGGKLDQFVDAVVSIAGGGNVEIRADAAAEMNSHIMRIHCVMGKSISACFQKQCAFLVCVLHSTSFLTCPGGTVCRLRNQYR